MAMVYELAEQSELISEIGGWALNALPRPLPLITTPTHRQNPGERLDELIKWLLRQGGREC